MTSRQCHARPVAIKLVSDILFWTFGAAHGLENSGQPSRLRAYLGRTPEMATVLWTSAAFCFVIGCVEPMIPLLVSMLPGGVQAYGVMMAMTRPGVCLARIMPHD